MEATTTQCGVSIWRGLFEHVTPVNLDEKLKEEEEGLREEPPVLSPPSSAAAASWGAVLGGDMGDSTLKTNPWMAATKKKSTPEMDSNSTRYILNKKRRTRSSNQTILRQIERASLVRSPYPMAVNSSRGSTPRATSYPTSLPLVLVPQQTSVNVFVGKRAVVLSNHQGVCLSSLEYSAIHSLRVAGGRYYSTAASYGQGENSTSFYQSEVAIPEEVYTSQSPSVRSQHLQYLVAGTYAQLNILANVREYSGNNSMMVGVDDPSNLVEVEVTTLEGEETTVSRIREALQYQWDRTRAEAGYRAAMVESDTSISGSLTLPVVEPDRMIVMQGARTRHGAHQQALVRRQQDNNNNTNQPASSVGHHREYQTTTTPHRHSDSRPSSRLLVVPKLNEPDRYTQHPHTAQPLPVATTSAESGVTSPSWSRRGHYMDGSAENQERLSSRGLEEEQSRLGMYRSAGQVTFRSSLTHGSSHPPHHTQPFDLSQTTSPVGSNTRQERRQPLPYPQPNNGSRSGPAANSPAANSASPRHSSGIRGATELVSDVAVVSGSGLNAECTWCHLLVPFEQRAQHSRSCTAKDAAFW